MHQGAISLCMLDLPSCFRQLSHQTLLIEFWGNRIKDHISTGNVMEHVFLIICHIIISFSIPILLVHMSWLIKTSGDTMYRQNIYVLCVWIYLNWMSLIPVSLMGFPLLLFISSSLPPLPLSLVADSADISLSSSPAFLNAWSLRFCKIIKENT